ncbi:tRNA (adenosine(37)-N6)-threonylcarbamoyltransferase complex dimerization subunit type 1 TsaB [Marivirga sp. S37H4]|uniref:tRNA (Adenosine(37)-N6)-threonylcarbamoyltransferase complex dimerization subunit type 1 TsaB n=1 Tax=Marivirga aurantiaca TaxID=2802615 RepID=A0A934X1I0_9BACT|nr:tRNA (adenosine(37)-N6)-threonylcarbamoyltransferase complex dimerization subunit type 1 TsaB [Marivirga aurantiaca]MBK6266670.1 tRNA (adenosine(37)-N6)-threonylcarbamoyltransferase complex dimerization subunit type 1 TsaB [Marivirga aurantiaca]
MITILSIETATSICSVAIHQDSKTLASADLFLEKSHSASLSLLIEQLLSHCDLRLADLNAVAVSSGPGSYTGLRIGLSTAKGLCYALDIPLIAISSLDTMCVQMQKFILNTSPLLIPMIDARRMEVFYKVNQYDLTEIEPLNNLILTEDSFDKYFDKYSTIYLFGNGASKASDLYKEKRNLIIIKDVNPSAMFMGKLAFGKYQLNQFEDLAYFEPDYGKEFFSPVSKKKSFL